MKHISSQQTFILYASFFVLIFISGLALSIGSYNVAISGYFFNELSDTEASVLTKIRFPRVLLSAFVGAALAISGACLQGLFRNPLADPGLIGVSAGAALGATSFIVLGSNLFTFLPTNPYLLPLASICGSAFVILTLFFITKGFGKEGITYLLLAGIAVNAFAGVGIGLLTYVSDDSELRGLTFWTMGSFGGANMAMIAPAILAILFSFVWIFQQSRKLDILQLGELEAYRLGIDIKKLRFNIIVSSAIIVGLSVSLSGMIGFVGLVVPHLSRIIGGVNHSYLLPCSGVIGATLMVLADLLARVMIKPAELPVGLITSAIGSPFFLWLIFRMRKT